MRIGVYYQRRQYYKYRIYIIEEKCKLNAMSCQYFSNILS
jgi:hypothetical protein